MDNNTSEFKGRKAALLTKHNKESVIKPLIEGKLGCEVIVESSFDTDQLGTFTMEITRAGTQLEAARLKALKAMELTGLDIGIASEGSFGPHPYIPILPYNVEIVIFIDKKENLEIHGIASNGDTNFGNLETDDLQKAEAFAKRSGFPSHYLIIKSGSDIIKGIDSWEQFYSAFNQLISKSDNGNVHLETDMRAHCNPTRMRNIKLATQDLIQKLQSRCPRCNARGFSVTDKRAGLPCEWCDAPTHMIIADIYECKSCGFREEKPVNKTEKAPAGCCDTCNP